MKNDNLLRIKLKQLFALDVNLKKYILNVNADILESCSKNLNKEIHKPYNCSSLNYKKFWFYAESIGEVKIALYLCELIKENIKVKNINVMPVFFISVKTVSAYKTLKSYNSININTSNTFNNINNINITNGIDNDNDIGNTYIINNKNIIYNAGNINNINNIENIDNLKSHVYGYNYNKNHSNNIIFFYHPIYFTSIFFKYYVNLIQPNYFISIEHSINNKCVEVLFNNNKNIKIYLLDLNFKKERYLRRYNLLKKQILNNIYINVYDKEDEINLENLFKSCKKISYNNYFNYKEENKNDNADKLSQNNLVINDNADKLTKNNLIFNYDADKSSQSNLTILEISDYPLKTASSFNNFSRLNKLADLTRDKHTSENKYKENNDNKHKEYKHENTHEYEYEHEHVHEHEYENIGKHKITENNKNVIVVSFISIHKKEAVFLIGILKSLNEAFFSKNIKFKFIFAPRNIKIIKLIKRKAEKENFKVIFYKKDRISIEKFTNYSFSAETDILAVDDYGKLDEVYSVSDIVYVGKSLFKEESGGHNILEPILYSKAVITGPYINNFKNIADTYIKNNAVKIIKKENFLIEFIKFIENNKVWSTMGEISFNIFKEQQEKNAENLNYFIKNEFLN
ncbi:MAG: hypothetical protein EVG15_05025 [Candidatus Acididesulfobacter diazotrophicus]|uniref:Lipid IV(A) 3-deoxy-D-manno-octulosonic acid transferase n=1 Tax=Candidatus Acididesulfobacter diazotrophicus TaxID=2597226 RepID=A0A519BMR2_9DELT|nr:MAG: hypothetical protein EVG15_05025 [Candidatus Acididesulfobacter diazotrophicus]